MQSVEKNYFKQVLLDCQANNLGAIKLYTSFPWAQIMQNKYIGSCILSQVIELSDTNSYAMALLGNFYCFGEGVEQDYDKAFDYYQKAAMLGMTDAMKYLASMYVKGVGVEQDYKTAIEWYLKANSLPEIKNIILSLDKSKCDLKYKLEIIYNPKLHDLIESADLKQEKQNILKPCILEFSLQMKKINVPEDIVNEICSLL